jgi:hypothetical protein
MIRISLRWVVICVIGASSIDGRGIEREIWGMFRGGIVDIKKLKAGQVMRHLLNGCTPAACGTTWEGMSGEKGRIFGRDDDCQYCHPGRSSMCGLTNHAIVLMTRLGRQRSLLLNAGVHMRLF